MTKSDVDQHGESPTSAPRVTPKIFRITDEIPVTPQLLLNQLLTVVDRISNIVVVIQWNDKDSTIDVHNSLQSLRDLAFSKAVFDHHVSHQLCTNATEKDAD